MPIWYYFHSLRLFVLCTGACIWYESARFLAWWAACRYRWRWCKGVNWSWFIYIYIYVCVCKQENKYVINKYEFVYGRSEYPSPLSPFPYPYLSPFLSGKVVEHDHGFLLCDLYRSHGWDGRKFIDLKLFFVSPLMLSINILGIRAFTFLSAFFYHFFIIALILLTYSLYSSWCDGSVIHTVRVGSGFGFPWWHCARVRYSPLSQLSYLHRPETHSGEWVTVYCVLLWAW